MYSTFQSRNEAVYPAQPQRKYGDVGPLRLTGIDNSIALFNKIARRNARRPYNRGDPTPGPTFWEDEAEDDVMDSDDDDDPDPVYIPPKDREPERVKIPLNPYTEDPMDEDEADGTIVEDDEEMGEPVPDPVDGPMDEHPERGYGIRFPPEEMGEPVPDPVDEPMDERPERGYGIRFPPEAVPRPMPEPKSEPTPPLWMTPKVKAGIDAFSRSVRRKAASMEAQSVKQKAAMDSAEHMMEAERHIDTGYNMDNAVGPSVPGRDTPAEEAQKAAEAVAVNAARAAANAANLEEVRRNVDLEGEYADAPMPPPAPRRVRVRRKPVVENDDDAEPMAPASPPARESGRKRKEQENPLPPRSKKPRKMERDRAMHTRESNVKKTCGCRHRPHNRTRSAGRSWSGNIPEKIERQ